MVLAVAILVWLAVGLCVGLVEQRNALLGMDKPPHAGFWVAMALLGAPLLAVALLFWLADLITGRR